MRNTTVPLFLTTLCAAVLTAAVPVDVDLAPESGDVPPPSDYYEGIHQGESRLATTLDEKQYDKLYLAMTDDIVPGLAQRHHDLDTSSPTPRLGPASSPYLIYSHWDPAALTDSTKTFRIYEKCDDIWVLQDGLWKLQNSTVTDMGPNWGLPPVVFPPPPTTY
ncbi:hypothetical protein F4778DRAFT_781081 [Xylariomycetidae sp. FL2044]|nr:hypothetical protein F4778DRAFT_781081 [Xylariomycetidae sp. FL2044]